MNSEIHTSEAQRLSEIGDAIAALIEQAEAEASDPLSAVHGLLVEACPSYRAHLASLQEISMQEASEQIDALFAQADSDGADPIDRLVEFMIAACPSYRDHLAAKA